ncbi:MAG: MBL fold metallo-hydrolase [Syntrophales bacterium]
MKPVNKEKRETKEELPFIKFLGTGGARFVVARQLRASGGVYISAEGKHIILDPGPGALVRCAASRPPVDVTHLDAVILTHAHIDHSNDVNILIDAMTEGGLKRRGILFAPEECLEGDKAVILKYLKGFPEKIVVLKQKEHYAIGDLRFSASVRHQHPVETYGILFHLPGCRLSFMVDTRFFPQLLESYKSSDILVMNVVRYIPHEKADIMHLSMDDVKRILEAIRPRKAILTHFGMTMLRAKPWEVAGRLAEETGIEVIAASDGLRVDL